MSVLDTLKNWLSPITDPVNELPGHLNLVQQTHLDSLDTFQSYMRDLAVDAPPDEGWTGLAAQDAVQWVEQYLASERALSAPGATLDAVTQATNTALVEVGDATETLAVQVEDDEVITSVTEVLVAADVAQGGLDPATDLAGLIMTVATIVLYFASLAAFGWSLYQAISTWINALHQAGNQPKPKLPPQPVALSQRAEQLARKYQAQGIDVDAQTIQDLIDAGYSDQEIDQIIRNLAKVYGPKGVKTAIQTLLPLKLTPQQAVAITAIMTQLNNPSTSPASSYLKGKPGEDIYADILAAMIMQCAQDAKTLLSSLQSAIQKARAKKGANLTQAEIIAAVQSTGVNWNSLPSDVQNLLLNNIGKMPYQFAYGNAIESLVKQELQNNYPDAYKYYTTNLGLQIEPYTVLPDGSVQYPDFKFTDNGKTIVEDLTSAANMASKIKYDAIAAILIAIGY